ncbi:MAG: hypothetical protein VX916_01355 [Planctomycetota bacterium]|nr:hypothetical protein [Planctomycetota bacterium]
MPSLPPNRRSFPKIRRARLGQRLKRAHLLFEASVLEELIEREPSNDEHLFQLGQTYTQLRSYKKGLDIDKKLVVRDPDHPTYRYNLACSLTLTRDLNGACRELLTAIDLGYRDFPFLMEDKDLHHLRNDSRFALIKDRIRDAQVADKSGPA